MRIQRNAPVKVIYLRILMALIPISCILSAGAGEPQTPSLQASYTEIKGKSVVDMTAAELRRVYSNDLSHVKFDPGQEQIDSLLQKTGDRVLAFFRDFTNTSSKEEVRMQRYRTGRRFYPSDARIIGLDYLPEDALQQSAWKDFDYLILPRSEKAGSPLSEYRTNKENQPIDQKVIDGFMISSGYAALCLYLHPSHQSNSKFRYVGRETRKPYAHVIAFAQKPESGDYLAQFYNADKLQSVRFLVQGLVWLDPDSSQILRMKTSMLSAEKETSLMDQITDAVYEKVVFDNMLEQFWLPRKVNVSWIFPNYTYCNLHQYSEYHLFAVKSDYKVAQPKGNK